MAKLAFTVTVGSKTHTVEREISDGAFMGFLDFMAKNYDDDPERTNEQLLDLMLGEVFQNW